MDTQFKVISAIGLTDKMTNVSFTGKLPHCYVKLIVGGVEYETTVNDRSILPKWDQTFHLAHVTNDTKIELQLRHKSSIPGYTHTMGEYKTTWVDIVCKVKAANPARIPLYASTTKTILRPHPVGHLVISVPPEFLGAPVDIRSEFAPRVTKQSVTPASAGLVVAGSALAAARQNVATARLGNGPNVSSVISAVESLKVVAERLHTLIGLVDHASKIHPIANMAWTVVSAVLTAMNEQADRDVQIVGLVSAMADAYDFLDTLKGITVLAPQLEANIDATLKQTVMCASFIQAYCRPAFLARVAKHALYSGPAKRIEDFKSVFQALRASRAEDISSCFIKELGPFVPPDREQLIGRLRPAQMDTSNRPTCLPNTRAELIQDITGWVTSQSNQSGIFWLLGLPGSGKSTIATTVANLFNELNWLGAFLFFSRESSQTSGSSHIIRTLAAQLALFDSRLGEVIADAIERHPHAMEGSLDRQFTELLVKPLCSEKVQVLGEEGPVVVVLDGLDQYGDVKAQEKLLEVLTTHAPALPTWLRIIVTSREEPHVKHALAACQNSHVKAIDITSPSNLRDVEAFVSDSMRRVRTAPKNKHLRLAPAWPGAAAIQTLSQRAAGLFVYASTVCSLIDAHDPVARLNAVLKGFSKSAELDSLFAATLSSAGDWNDDDFVSSYRDIVGLVLAAHEPLTADIIDSLTAQPGRPPCLHTLQSLGCILSYAAGAETPTIRIVHPTFAEYLTSPQRCGNTKWFINVAEHRRILAIRCLHIVAKHLAGSAEDLALSSSELQSHLTPTVQHAYRFWIEYLCSVTDNLEDLIEDVALVFFGDHLVLWSAIVEKLWSKYVVFELTWKLMKWADTNALVLTHLSGFRITKELTRGLTRRLLSHMDVLFDDTQSTSSEMSFPSHSANSSPANSSLSLYTPPDSPSRYSGQPYSATTPQIHFPVPDAFGPAAVSNDGTYTYTRSPSPFLWGDSPVTPTQVISFPMPDLTAKIGDQGTTCCTVIGQAALSDSPTSLSPELPMARTRSDVSACSKDAI
ncbi:hypothetical protein EIP91_008547 [Steccherinum ochraceum]|uniref:C2 domain-containing protein n=1 Tax=Steccherinum ochraceum TaxID=92696 RepID=A0A4R0RCN8_9APHY|nr:hypothetical protein EIP91_008547 [Steccherinum ochraceum]